MCVHTPLVASVQEAGVLLQVAVLLAGLMKQQLQLLEGDDAILGGIEEGGQRMALMAAMMAQWCGKVQHPSKHGNMVCGGVCCCVMVTCVTPALRQCTLSPGE